MILKSFAVPSERFNLKSYTKYLCGMPKIWQKMKQILVQPALPKPKFRDEQAKILNLAAKISTYLFSYILFTILYVGQSLVSKSKNEVETNKIYKFKKSSSCCCQFLIMKYSLGFFLKDKQGSSLHTH